MNSLGVDVMEVVFVESRSEVKTDVVDVVASVLIITKIVLINVSALVSVVMMLDEMDTFVDVVSTVIIGVLELIL
jgi:hypothetical protein